LNKHKLFTLTKSTTHTKYHLILSKEQIIYFSAEAYLAVHLAPKHGIFASKEDFVKEAKFLYVNLTKR
jgi:hypothetical protein